MFKFLHAADIHLDSPLRGLDRYEGAPVEELRGATRRALERLVGAAIEHRVDFVVIAGDLYDGDWRDFDTGLFFVTQMRRLREAEIPVFGVFGNHDAASKITKRLPLPSNVQFFPTGKPATERIDSLGVAIHGQSFAQQRTTANLAKGYPSAVPGCFNLGVLHTSLAGREGHDSYAPCTETQLRDSGYDYWALGHIHQREVLTGTPTIAYSGNPQGRHIGEPGPRGCLLVEVGDRREVTVEFVSLDVLRWETLAVGLDGVESHAAALERVRETLVSAVEDAGERLTAARVVLRGETPMADAFRADPQQLTADVRSIAIDVGAERLWIEKVRNQTSRPKEESDAADDDNPLLEVGSLVAEMSRVSGISEALGLDLSVLAGKLPPEVRAEIKADDLAWWRDVLADAEALLFADNKEQRDAV